MPQRPSTRICARRRAEQRIADHLAAAGTPSAPVVLARMLRKEILRIQQPVSKFGASEIDIATVATVLVTSEDPQHPIDHAFDGQRGPGATRWIAGQSGTQTVIVAFDAPQAIRNVIVEIYEPETERTQEMDVSISTDGGSSYRHVLRQEYNFSPRGTSYEHEHWSVAIDGVTHVKVTIKPDKGGKSCRATLTAFALETERLQ